MKVYAIVPIRSGSKGLPNKNMLPLGEKPLVMHTIDALRASNIEHLEIYVSTDSDEYIKTLEEYGVSCLKRSPELAKDTTPTSEVLLDFLKGIPEKSTFILCQATSPFRTGEDIKHAFDLFNPQQDDAVVSCTLSAKSLSFFTRITEAGYIPDIAGLDKGYRRQNQASYYYPNGAIFISTREAYERTQSFFTVKTKASVMSEEHSLDIDTRMDYEYAQYILNTMK